MKPVIDAVGAALSKFADKARDVISFFSGGLIEDSKLHKLNDSLEKAAKESEKMSAEYKKQADLLEAEGMSAQSIAQRRAEALKEEQKALIDHLKVEKDATKQAELRDQISKNTVEILGQQKSVIEGMASDMQKQGKTEGEIYQAKEDQIRASIALIAQERLRKDLTDEQNKSLEAQARLMTNMLKETMEEHKKYDADQAKEAYARALESAKKTADLRLSVAKEGSDKELQARLDVMKADSALELNNTKLTRTQVELIKLKLAQDTAREIQAFYQKALAEAEKDEKKSDQEKYDARMAILNRERAAIANNDKLSAAQKIELFKQVNAQEDAAWKQLNDSLTQKEKQAATARLAAAQAEARKKLDIALQVSENEYKAGITAEEKILSDRKEKYEADLSNAKLSIKARMDLGEQYYSSVEASLQKEMQLLNKKYASDIAAAQKDEQAMEKLQDQYLKDSKAIEDKITVNKKEQANKRKEYAKEQGKQEEDIAKQVGQKLIEMARQVSDAIFENQKQKRDNELKDKLDNLDAQKDAELMNATLTAAQRKAIEKKYKREEAHEKEKAWKADQKAKAEQAVINGLLAFTAALASSPPPMNYVNAAIALASAGIQAGIIMSKTPPKFAKGVVALEGPGTETSDSIPAYLSRGESVITASATRRYQPLLEAMNAGTLDRYMPLPQMPDVKALEVATTASHRAQAEKIDYEKIGEVLARRINMKQLHVSID
ncbi:MAG: hypothetical protein JST76_15460 [Bacteroidetes bacterium]|nr:hypothetical protein [Bacteroidota bacterium]